MRLERDETTGAIRVVLSRRNLRSLLAKLDGHPKNSHMTIGGPSMYEPFWVVAEEDDVHYAHPSREGCGPGDMHPDTEEAIA